MCPQYNRHLIFFASQLCGPGVPNVAVDHGYRCVATSVEGFIQQLAVSYIANGYYFYVQGRIPEGKDPAAVDGKLVRGYSVGISKWARARRKLAGTASMQYLRHDRVFVLLATHGEHVFFEREKGQVRDCRRRPIKYAGYSVSYRGGHAHVRIEQNEYNRLKSYLLEVGLHRRTDLVAEVLRRLPFEPYAPVRRQLLNILRAVNRLRKLRGFEPVPFDALRLKRRVVRPFELTGEIGSPASQRGNSAVRRSGEWPQVSIWRDSVTLVRSLDS